MAANVPEERRTNLAAIRAARVGSFVWDIATDEVQWSDELCRIHGIEPWQFGGDYGAFLEHVHPEDLARVKAVLEEALESPAPFMYDHRIVRPDGVVRTIHSQGDVETDDDGSPVRFIGACWDVTEPAAAHRELERSLSLLRATLEATADGILVVDRDQQVVTYNEQFLRLWRIPEELAARGDDTELLAYVEGQLVDPGAFFRKVHELYDRPEEDSLDVVLFRDGRTFERISKPQRLGDRVVGRVWSFSDVTAREKAIAARELFLATAAHEIRGPLMSIRLAVQALQSKDYGPSQAPKLLEIADREITRLSRFVEQLLDVGRVRAGRLELGLEDVDLVEVVEDVVASMGHEIRSSGSKVSIRRSARPVVRADRSRLGQVVTNLLSNALKFGEGRPVELDVGKRNGWATLDVTDRGVGMTEEELACIFEPFERRVSTRHYGGLGLGLHIVQSLVAAMGGAVSATSERGRGSQFTLELPAEKER